MKVGILRCQQTESICPGTGCFNMIAGKKGAFKDVEEPIEIVGFVSCGGCPGKNASPRAEMLKKRGADTIALASCITRGTPMEWPCPHAETMEKVLKKRLGDDINFLDFTH